MLAQTGTKLLEHGLHQKRHRQLGYSGSEKDNRDRGCNVADGNFPRRQVDAPITEIQWW
jgi:hypothetical protein